MKEDILQKIESLYELDKHQEIIELIEALPAEQLNAEIVSELGRAYNNSEEYEKGLEVLKSIEFEEANNFRWNCRIAYSYYFLDDFVNAEKYLLIANKLNPEDDFTHTLLIETYISLARVEDENGNHDKAIEYALEAGKYARDEEGEANATSFLAWLYDRYGHYTEAEELLKNMLNKNKSNEWLYSELGFCLAEQGRQEEALEYYLKAFELREDDIFLMSDIAWLYDSLGEFEKALKYLERLEELGQDDAWTNTEYGYCLSKLRRYEEAIVKINRALEIEDDEKDTAYIYSQLGWCQRHLEKYDEAIEAFSQAKKWARNDAWINIEIGHCYKAKNEREKALDFYLKAEKFD